MERWTAQRGSGIRARGGAAGVVLLLVALTLGVWGSSASADTADITSGSTMSVTDCADVKTKAGTVTITRAGGNQFAANTALTVSGSAASGKITVSGSGNSGSGANGSSYAVSFTTTVAANTPSGTYSVSVSVTGAKQGSGTNTLSASGSVSVTVVCDAVAPVVTFGQASVTAAADRVVGGVVGANVSYTVSATDAVDSSPDITCSKGAGAFFAVGAHTVSCTATDDSGNTSLAANLPVTVTADVTKPVVDITPAGPLTVPAAAQQDGVVGATVAFTAAVTDNVTPAPAATCDKASGAFFAVGSHTVTCTATDASGNVAVADTLSITVSPDVTAPVAAITPAGPLSIEANTKRDGVPGALVEFAPSATDAIDPAPGASCDTPSGTFFAVGAHTVTCWATDSSDNKSGNVTLSITVTPDVTKPVVSFAPGGPVSVEAGSKQNGVRGAVVDFTVSATDSLDGALAPDCDGEAGFFPVGTTSVTCTATDAAGNKSASATLSVTVTPDVTKPAVATDPAGPLTLVVNAERDGVPGRAVTFTAAATDTVDGTLQATCAPVSGTFFAVGAHTVTCSATDGSGNTQAVSLSITIQPDTTAPVLALPSLAVFEATGPGGRTVSYTVTATDNSTVVPPVTCVPASGSTFAIGQTTVNCEATDGSGNKATGAFAITVADGTGPAMSGPATVSKEATGPTGAPATFTVTASDLVSGTAAVTCVPASGSTFPVGATGVSCSAEDAAGNGAVHDVTVTVTDTTAPAVSAPSPFTTQATSADGAVISFASSATDIVDGFLTPTCAPASGSAFPVGQTTVVCTVKDAAGNTGQASFVITVQPLAEDPSEEPTVDPTEDPTEDPTVDPTEDPTVDPTEDPTVNPTESPTESPTENPTVDPTESPTRAPVESPGETPVAVPPSLPEPDRPKPVARTPQPREQASETPAAPAPEAAPLPGSEPPVSEAPRGVEFEPVPGAPAPAPDAVAAGPGPVARRPITRAGEPEPVAGATGSAPADGEGAAAGGDAGESPAAGQSGSDSDDGVPEGLDAADVQAGTVIGRDGQRLAEGEQGERFRFVAGGFGPFSWVDLEFHSDPIRLGRVRADRHGVVDVEITIGDHMPTGSHHVVAFGTDPSGLARQVRVGLTVIPAAVPAGGLPVAPVLAALASLAILAAGVHTVRSGHAPGRPVRV